MVIHQHVALGGFAADLGKIVHHDLIAALHEIDFNSLHSPLFKLIQRRNQLVIQRLPRCPKNQSDIFLLGIRDQLIHVELRRDLKQIA